MGRKKVLQKNTLAQWAGVKEQDRAGPSLLLKFKIDPAKLAAQQRSSTGPGSQSADLPLSNRDVQPSATAAVIAENPAEQRVPTTKAVSESTKQEPHPFFHLAKRKRVEAATQSGLEGDGAGTNAAELASNKNVPNPTLATKHEPKETHSFFKPRPGAASAQGTDGTSPVVKQSLKHALLPTRETLHVVPDTCHGDKTGNASLPWRRRTPTTAAPTNAPNEWQCGHWTDMSVDILSRAKCSNQKMPGVSKTVSAKRSKGDSHFASRDHGALHAINNRAAADETTPDLRDGNLWTSKYAPVTASGVLQNGSEAFVLRDWLKSRRLHNRHLLDFMALSKKNAAITDKYANENDDFILDDFEALLTSDIGADFDLETDELCPAGRETMFKSNLIILSGPTGCGKSAAIQAVACELDFEVFEVNSMDRRSGKDVIERVGEAAQSQMVNKTKAAGGAQSRSLILFEEVDILYRDDKEFWHSVLTLVSTSKRPIVLTCNDLSILPRHLQIPGIVLELSPPSNVLATDYLQTIAHFEGLGHILTRDVIQGYLELYDHDLRATIHALQFLGLSDQLPQDPSVDTITEELMSREIPVNLVYRGTRPPLGPKNSRSSIEDYDYLLNCVSFVDLMDRRQRSTALEAPEVFENDTEELFARPIEKDDLVGYHMISEPVGRYTRLHPGDRNIALQLAFEVQDILPPVADVPYPTWAISYKCPVPISDQSVIRDEQNWDAMLDASEPFAVPENWMYDYSPPSAITRPKLSGVLASDIMPYLRRIVEVEDARTALEKSYGDGGGRTTRNTMSGEYGFKRPPKIPESMREAIRTTGLVGAERVSLDGI